MRHTIALILLMTVALTASSLAQTEEAHQPGTLNAYIANDSLAGADRGYTGGLKLGWMSPSLRNTNTKKAWKWLPFVRKPGFLHTFSLSLGFNIFTPLDLREEDLIEDDRPYAGILYLAFGIHSQSQIVMDSWEFDVGIVGPHSYAEQAQKFVHKLINQVIPGGWDHQLKDELVLQLIYERKWRYSSAESRKGFGFDVIPHLGGGLGNVYIYGSTGVQVRWGWHLPDDFGIPGIRPGGDPNLSLHRKGPFSAYAFAALDGKAVLRNIFLDGNTFLDSHRVDKIPFTLGLIGGLGMRTGHFNFTYVFVFWTKKFTIETEHQVFGSLNISYSY